MVRGTGCLFDLPRGHGEALGGKSILIGYEAGHGDMIRFSRYAAGLKAMGAGSISIICHPALKTLFASLEAVDAVLHFDEQIPAILPYLQAPHGHIAMWAPFLLTGAGWRIERILPGTA